LSYNIYKCKDGGFIVYEGRIFEERGMYNGPLFASAKIGEALEYIRQQMEKIL